MIADEDGDYYTIDVLNAGDGNSPVFKLRAGATSCPHEGVEYSKYFEPGKHTLSDGSAKIESPELTIETPVIAGIPSGSAAEFPLVFKNNSDLAQETSSTFALNIDDATNPNGLVIEMDGVPLGGPGSLISVPSGVGVRKLITVRQTNTSITDYEKVTLVLSSTCDNNLSLAVFRIPCIRI